MQENKNHTLAWLKLKETQNLKSPKIQYKFHTFQGSSTGRKQGITLAMKTNIKYINNFKQTGREIDGH